MKLTPTLMILIAMHVGLSPVLAQDAVKKTLEPWPDIDGAIPLVYKTIGDVKLHLHTFRPADWKPTDRRPAIVFFFGGGWVGGKPLQFAPQCKYLATRGRVAMPAEYRVKSRHGTSPFACVADGKSAVRWIREHADELGVDPNRIAAGGGSAGGHVAASTGVLQGLEESGEPTSVSSVPDALVLFNPAVDTTPSGSTRAAARIGPRNRELSVTHHVRADLPPTIIFHGTADKAVNIETVRRFRTLMQGVDNRCELVEYEGKPHGFFNLQRNEEMYRATLTEADRFLGSLGYVEGPPTVGE